MLHGFFEIISREYDKEVTGTVPLDEDGLKCRGNFGAGGGEYRFHFGLRQWEE
jgi:hypothetical protein